MRKCFKGRTTHRHHPFSKRFGSFGSRSIGTWQDGRHRLLRAVLPQRLCRHDLQEKTAWHIVPHGFRPKKATPKIRTYGLAPKSKLRLTFWCFFLRNPNVHPIEFLATPSIHLPIKLPSKPARPTRLHRSLSFIINSQFALRRSIKFLQKRPRFKIICKKIAT